MKPLSEYVSGLGHLAVPPIPLQDIPIAGVSNNSKSVKGGFLFCAIPGSRQDGHAFLPEAIANGAAAALIFKEPSDIPPSSIPLVRVSDPYFAWASACETFFGNPSSRLSLHAITGTNGKTTTAFILRSLIREAMDEKCGLISTIEYDDGSGSISEASRTTPDAFEFQSLLSRAADNACKHVAMEASSHGLHQRRAAHSKFSTAAFSNLTGDHLDYHHDMESYYQAKRLLFAEMLDDGAAAVINIDDPWGGRLAKELAHSGVRILTLSKGNPSACRIEGLSLASSGSSFTLSTPDARMPVKTSLIGEHNAYNLATAAIMALSAGANPDSLSQALSKPFHVPGRLESFKLPSGAVAFVDYAHTDDALFRVLSAVKPLCKGSLITVFGCGGDRDKSKRPRMASASASLSSVSIVTSDNPRTEDPNEIISQVKAGFPADSLHLEIPDRMEAISKAVSISSNADIVLVAGKGHEQYQEANGFKAHFDDREALISLGASKT